MKATILLAVANADEYSVGFGPISPALRERLVLVGAIGLVVLAIFAGILLRRRLKRQRSKQHDHSRRRHPHSYKQTVAGVVELKQMIHKKLRRRHREHRPRNPTLAEAGGLPPVRPDQPLESEPRRTQPQ